ncbi:hypothetical protein FHT78_001857 [Rhizobium sp. BK196]|uniref:hypothetical protein n=1 Tax=Rhizobium sp. BK196 TaxID=2587073 RepID=UPI00160EBDFA|nr:hypothetical protein [Rhizobium sp. BK196]
MSKDLISPLMRIQIQLAIASSRRDFDALRFLELEAKQMTLSGAEIDAAKRGVSFDLFVEIAVKFALAIEAGDGAASALASRQLRAFGAPDIASELRAFIKKLEPSKARSKAGRQRLALADRLRSE